MKRNYEIIIKLDDGAEITLRRYCDEVCENRFVNECWADCEIVADKEKNDIQDYLPEGE